MIVTPDKRVVPRAAVDAFRASNDYRTANPGGPPGTSTMTYFCIFQPKRAVSTSVLFARSTALTSGWAIYIATATIKIYCTNSTPAAVEAGTYAIDLSDVGKTLIVIGAYVNGVITCYINGVAFGTATVGSGITTQSTLTAIGTRSDGSLPATSSRILECGMLQSFDVTSTVLATSQQWQEDLQQGRYLTWPHAADINNDWYWSARDAVAGPTCKTSWLDRIQGSTMTRNGAPQGSGVIPRY